MTESSLTSEQVIHNWIHQNFGKKSGLLQDEYKIVFNPEQSFDIGWHSGACIIISIKYPLFPDLELCKSALRRAFDNPYLFDFKRSKALVKYSDAVKYRDSTFTGIAKQLPKRSKGKFVTEMITYVRIRDIKTKAEVTVEVVNSDAFTATNKALRMLYGGAEE